MNAWASFAKTGIPNTGKDVNGKNLIQKKSIHET